MNRFTRRFGLMFLLAAPLLLPDSAPAAHHEAAEGGVMMGEKVTLRGKVISIDKKNRSIVVEGEQGRQVEISAPKDSPNFDQIKVGNPVVATYVEAVALAIEPVEGAEPGASAVAAVSTAPPGAEPSAAIAERVQLRAVVNSIDSEARTVTLDVPEGGQRTLKVGESVDLAKVKKGEQVSVTFTRALAISIETQ